MNPKLSSIDTIDGKRESNILTVTALTSSIKQKLESNFPNIIVQGEISNFKPTSSGHLYFDLKDAGAKIPAVLFKNSALNLPRLPKEGDHVMLRGAISVYAPHGRYQLIATSLQYVGMGELLLKLEELKKELHRRGWFAKETKKPLPPFPKRIGVVTSPTGAVIQDIIQVLSRRDPGCHLILNPVRVQGSEAAGEIAMAIEQFNRYELADVLIVGRGGGSLEDLWPFNEEIVARAIFESKIPIISAVGHETDFTIADFVADLRAPTPSAAAEIVSSEKVSVRSKIDKAHETLTYTLSHLVKRSKERLYRFSSSPFFSNPYSLTAPLLESVETIEKNLTKAIGDKFGRWRILLSSKEREKNALKPQERLLAFRRQLLQLQRRVDESGSRIGLKEKERLKQVTQTLGSLNPKNVLSRGYSILFSQKKGSVIVSSKELSSGTEVRALLADGESKLKVID